MQIKLYNITMCVCLCKTVIKSKEPQGNGAQNSRVCLHKQQQQQVNARKE